MNEHRLNPGEILGISGYYWKTFALQTGVKLDLFTAIGESRMSAGEIAEKLNLDSRALEMLLNALTAMELLVKEDRSYRNSSAAAKFLSMESPDYIGYIIMHHHHLVQSWAQLDEAIRTGKPVRDRVSLDTEEARKHFLMGMFNMAMNTAPQLVSKIDLSGRQRLLDLGGGPGTYAIHFCKHNPELTASVFDLPTTRPFAEETIERFEMADRITFQEGNYLEDHIGGRFDVAWLSQILHGEGPEDCRQIIHKTVKTLDPGGLIIIHEFILDDAKDSPLFPALFSLNMLLGTDSGQAYSEGELSEMLAGAGVENIRRLPFKGPTESGILAGHIK